jgi:hypothetical protein
VTNRLLQDLAKEEGLSAYGMRSYVNKFFADYPELHDLISSDQVIVDDTSSHQRRIYSSHISMKDISDGLRVNKFFKGVLRCKRDDWNDCYVVLHDFMKPGVRKSVNIKGLSSPRENELI